MTSDYIWLCNSLADVGNWRALTSDLAERDRQLAIECGKRNDAGESLGRECFPMAIWPTAEAKADATSAADFFYAGTHWIVSAHFADLLRQFDMGGAHLYPVRFLHKDRETLVADQYFCINFGNVKEALSAERSKNIWQPYRGKHIWTILGAKDEDIVFSRATSSGGDIWIDPALRSVICLSAGLGDAMRETGTVRGFKGPSGMLKGQVGAD